MKTLKVCFVGIGSIAERHIRNLQFLCKDKGINLQIDAFRRNFLPAEGVNTIYTSLDSLPNDYDAIFICNPTDLHFDTLERFHEKGRNFFIEKPVVALNQIEKAKEFKKREGSVYYVAAPLRYNAVIKWIKENISPSDVISVRSISSSYLPDWRPGKDYRQSYSAHKGMGGGVSVDLIHEWDYITYLFGFPEKVSSYLGKKSKLEIDSDDIAVYIAEFSNMIAELHLDYFGKKTIREIQLFTVNDTIIGDIAANKIRFLKAGYDIDFHENRDDYQKRELQYFINQIAERKELNDWFYHGIKVLELTQGRLHSN